MRTTVLARAAIAFVFATGASTALGLYMWKRPVQSAAEAPPLQLSACFALSTSVGAGKDLPDTELPCLGDGGGTFRLNSLANERLTIISFWASWCQPCRQEIPALRRYASSHSANVRVATVLTRDSRDSSALMAELGAPFPVAWDENGKLLQQLKMPEFLPATLVIGRDGALIKSYQGSALSTEASIEALLGEEK